MEFKRSAGVFVAGISLFFGGPLLAFAGQTFMIWAVSRDDRGLVAVLIGVSILGAVLGLVGFVMLVVAAHRALVKIDALPVRVQQGSRQDWSVTR